MPERDAFVKDLITDPLQWLFEELHTPAKCVDEVWGESWRARPGGKRLPDRITVDYQEMFPCPTA